MTLGHGLYGLQEAKPAPKPPSRWRLARRIVLIIFVLMTASLFMLSMIGSASDNFKKLLEEYLSQATGMQASIGTLNKFSFYPAMSVDVEDMVFQSGGADKGLQEVIRVGTLRFSIGFWSAATGKIRFRVLHLGDAVFQKGVYLPRDLAVKRAGIDPEEDALVVDAVYGGEPVHLRIDLRGRPGLAGIPSYALAEDAEIDLKMGNIVLKGILNRERFNTIHLALEEFRAGNISPVSGELRIGEGMAGNLKAGESDFTLDLPYDIDDGRWNFRGNITGNKLVIADITGDKGLVEAYQRVKAFVNGPELMKARHAQPYNLSFLDVDVSFSYENFIWSGALSGPASARLRVQNGIATLEPASQDWNDAILSGLVTLDATKNPSMFSAKITLEDMNYANLQNHVRATSAATGRADVKIDLRSTGNNMDQFWQGLQGGIMAVAGPGELTSALINLWGGGLANAMLPDLDSGDSLRLNCGVGSFRVKGPVAETEALLIDTDKVTIVGDGQVNLRDGTLDLELDPDSKDVAFLSMATSVDVEGPWRKPSVSPQGFSLMARLGELFLGTINPAFLVFSMTDFGLEEKHPCRAYIKP